MGDLSTVEKIFDLDTPLFSRDFIVVDLLPSVVLTGSVVGVLMAGAPKRAPSGDNFTAALAHTTGTSLVMLLALSTAVAVAVHPLRMRNRRLLTGVWTSRIGDRLAKMLIERWMKPRFRRANEAVKQPQPGVSTPGMERKAQNLRRRYPPPRFLTPTQLGNAYEALRKLVPEKDRPQTSVVYDVTEPQAYRHAYAKAAAAKDPILAQIADMRLQIAAAERYTVTWIVAACLYTLLLATHGRWLLLSVAALALAHVAYVGAVDSVVEFNYLLDRLYALEDLKSGTDESAAEQPGAQPAA